MLPRTTQKTADMARDRLFWLGATSLVLAQVLAFWMLCSHQVRKAEVRHAGMQVERVAVADCLRHVPNATLLSCASRIAPLDRDVASAGGRGQGGMDAVPVNYVYR